MIHPLNLFQKKTYLDLVGGPPDVTNGIRSALERSSTYYHISSSNKNTFHDVYSSNYIGYSKVLVKEQNLSDESQSYLSEVNFVNEAPVAKAVDSKFLVDVPMKYATNGRVKKKVFFNNLLDTVRVEEFTYSVNNMNSYPINILLDRKFIGALNTNFCGQVALVRDKQFYIVVYPYYNFNVQLISKSTQDYLHGILLIQSEVFEYYPSNYLLSKSRKTLSNGLEEITEIKYAGNYTGANEQLMVLNNMIGIPIEQKKISNNIIKQYLKTEFAPFGNFSEINPSSIYDVDKDLSLRLIVDFVNYDQYGNPVEVRELKKPSAVYLWGYGGQYPIAKIENASYAEVVMALGSTSGAILNGLNASNVSDATINTHMKTLRDNLVNSMVTSYTYSPLTGMKSMTDPRGQTEYYEYDGFQRLKEVLDFERNVLTDYQYHYKP